VGGPTLQPGVARPLSDMGCLVPQPYATRMNQSYPEFYVLIDEPRYQGYFSPTTKLAPASMDHYMERRALLFIKQIVRLELMGRVQIETPECWPPLALIPCVVARRSPSPCLQTLITGFPPSHLVHCARRLAHMDYKIIETCSVFVVYCKIGPVWF
jgi:hypothetical protein